MFTSSFTHKFINSLFPLINLFCVLMNAFSEMIEVLGTAVIQYNNLLRHLQLTILLLKNACLYCTIRKYGNTFSVGISKVKNGRLYLRYRSSSEKTTAKCNETVTDKAPCLYYCKKCPKSSATPLRS